jgi:NAD(P)-dependent dehydrogenase (short-subunit alcohol dehydrogenase family)
VASAEACATWVLAEAGARVVVADNDGSGACRWPRRSAASPLAHGRRRRGIGRGAGRCRRALRRVDVLVNCAGVLQRTLPPDQLSLKEWDFVARVDLRGTYLCCARFGSRHGGKRGRGAIVNIASVAGMRSGPLHSYARPRPASST